MPVANRTAAADNDIRDIGYYIGIESGRPSVADEVVDDLIACCDRLAELSSISRIGTNSPELGRGIRLLSHRRWVIIFRYVDDGVLILRIADGSQDYFSWKFG